jgi:hypothetical protein
VKAPVQHVCLGLRRLAALPGGQARAVALRVGEHPERRRGGVVDEHAAGLDRGGDPVGFQYSATEIVDALTHLAAIQHSHRTGPSPLVDEVWSDAA